MSLSKRAKRIWTVLAIFATVLAIAAWWVNKQLEPTKLTNTVLGKIGEELNLKFEFSGKPSYAMKPEPRLVLPNLQVRSPIDNKIFLSAKRVEVSLPWSTILGDTPHVTRLEAIEPTIDLPGLLAWQATRPAKPFEVPTFTDGLEISNGQLIDTNYAIKKIQLSLPHLEDKKPIEAEVSGEFAQDNTKISFSGPLTIANATLSSNYSLKSKGELQLGQQKHPYQISTEGKFTSLEKSFDIENKTVVWTSASPLPNLQGTLNLSIGDSLKLESKGVLAEWLKDWPVLPAPMNKQTKNIPYEIHYQGKLNFSDAFNLNLQLDKSRFSSALKMPELQTWLDKTNAAPLPPLQGNFEAPLIQLDGVSLEGVSIEITPDVEK